MIIISIACSIFTGKINELSSSVLDGASSAIELVFSLMGTMCLFTGLLKIADEGGLTKFIAKLLSPVVSRLFPDCKKDSSAFKAICMNITANLLGLGNAATPLGIKAMKEMEKDNKIKGRANNSMVMFVVINTASLQLVPTMMSALRQKHGAASPFDVLPAIWLTSTFSLLVGIAVAKFLERRK